MASKEESSEDEQEQVEETIDDYFPSMRDNLVIKKRDLYRELFKAQEGFNLRLKAPGSCETVGIHREFFQHCVQALDKFNYDADGNLELPLPDTKAVNDFATFLYTGFVGAKIQSRREPVAFDTVKSFYQSVLKCNLSEPTKELVLQYVTKHCGITHFKECEKFAKDCDDTVLKSTLHNSLFRSASFYVVRRKHQFLHLNYEDFTYILDHDYFNPGREASVLGLMVAWIRFDFEKRISHIVPLMARISFPGLLQEDMKKLKNRCTRDKRFRQEMKSLFSQIYEYSRMGTREILEIRQSYKNSNLKPRKAKPWVYLTSVAKTEEINTIYSLTDWVEMEEECLEWLRTKIPEKPTLTTATRVLFSESRKTIYLWEDGTVGTLFQCDLNAEKRLWEKIATMTDATMSCAVLLVDSLNIVVLTGGKKDAAPTTSVVYLDLNKPENGWKKLASLTEPRFGAELQWCSGKMYLFGGYGEDGEAKKTVQVLSLSDGIEKATSWTHGAEMLQARAQHSSCIFGGKIYTYGGLKHKTSKKPVAGKGELFDPETGKWSALPETRHAHEDFSLVATEHATSFKNGPELWIFDKKGEYFDNSLKKWLPRIILHASGYASYALIPEAILL
ncbi:Kelch-like protein 18 [Cichlidogyrus casuarinus]|uniref:Kelch-like protein 18 n=1 Tax=Cichlidogyrus casuarinus TaxID=1844966 RepID=A0ABD2Q097_9PLAT